MPLALQNPISKWKLDFGVDETSKKLLSLNLVLQRDFIVLRDFGWYYEILRLRRFELCRCDRERACLR